MLAEERGPFVVSPYVVEELDCLLLDRLGVDAELTALGELGSGAWELAQFYAAGLRTAHQIIERYRDQEIGVADASLVVLAAQYHTDRILTLDRRHFGALRTLGGGAFTILPA